MTNKQEEIREGVAEKIFEWCKRKGYIVASFEWKDLQGATRGLILAITDIVLEYEASQGVVIKVDRELPKELTNNIGCMSKEAIEDFATTVLRECGYPHRMEWTTAGDILIGETIYIDETHINEYPYLAKERVLHEVAHIDTHPQDDRHSELFHRRYAELVNRFLAGYVAVELLI